MVLRFMKSVVFGAVVLLLALPYLALSYGVLWGATLIPFPESLWANGVAPGLIAIVTMVPLILTAFRIDRGAARLAGLVEEEQATFLFVPTKYWLSGFIIAAVPLLLILVIRIVTLDNAGVIFLKTPLGEIDPVVAALNHFDILTVPAVMVYFFVYGVNSVRRSVFERDPPSLCSAWASVILFALPFVFITKIVVFGLLDALVLLPVDGFIVTRDLTFGHALAMQVAILWCLFATNSALVLRARLIRILDEIETQRMLPE
ncbi:MAG: hypothetical protein AAGC81_12575 [Pseudomonadota bacterium]